MSGWISGYGRETARGIRALFPSPRDLRNRTLGHVIPDLMEATMTSSTIAGSASTGRTAGLRFSAAVVIAAAGPLAIAVLRLILPYDTTDDAAATVEKVAASPAAEGAVLWLTYLALLTLPLGVLITGRQAMRARPALGAVAALIAWVGFTSLFASVAIGDYLAQAAPTTAAPTSTTAALLDAINALPATTTASTVFVAGHILGGILLGIALWRVVPAWAAVALTISQPLHLVFAVFVPNHVLDGVAWALTAVGFAAAALAWAKSEHTVR
ncbi:MAG: hypothetical protein ACRDTX_09165 [Pseudonocardiaceae bacterium]